MGPDWDSVYLKGNTITVNVGQQLAETTDHHGAAQPGAKRRLQRLLEPTSNQFATRIEVSFEVFVAQSALQKYITLTLPD